jgi:hypothetical protein
MRWALFWDVTQPEMAVSYRNLEQPIRPIFKGQAVGQQTTGLIGCPETSVINYHCKLFNIPETAHISFFALVFAIPQNILSLRMSLWRPSHASRTQCVHRLFTCGKAAAGFVLTTHPHLAPRLRMIGAMLLLPLHAFMVWTGTSGFIFEIKTCVCDSTRHAWDMRMIIDQGFFLEEWIYHEMLKISP